MIRLITLAVLFAPTASLMGQNPVVILDPGHGGQDPGAQFDGVVEKQLNLAMAHAIAASLTDAGFDVRLTRSGDEFVTPLGRAGLAETLNAVALVSLHFDARVVGDTRTGSSIFIRPDDPRSAAFGSILFQTLADLPVEFAAPEPRNLAIFRDGIVPAVMINLGTLTHGPDLQLAADRDYRDAAATRLVAALRRFIDTPSGR